MKSGVFKVYPLDTLETTLRVEKEASKDFQIVFTNKFCDNTNVVITKPSGEIINRYLNENEIIISPSTSDVRLIFFQNLFYEFNNFLLLLKSQVMDYGHSSFRMSYHLEHHVLLNWLRKLLLIIKVPKHFPWMQH